jgi:putative SOS response-associated peptidase YedK
MCGRFTLRTPARQVAELFDLPFLDELRPRYNVAPTQQVLGVRLPAGGRGREAALFHWGLVPAWAQDPSIGNKLINARCETAATRPAFRAAMRDRRLLIPADGFYEWKRAGKHKQPYLVELKVGGPFAFAGLWERWHPSGDVLESCTILTTNANDLLAGLHNRMPVILHPDDFDEWLDTARPPTQLARLWKPFPANELRVRPVSSVVNSAHHEGPDCVKPPAAAEPGEPGVQQKSLLDGP